MLVLINFLDLSPHLKMFFVLLVTAPLPRNICQKIKFLKISFGSWCHMSHGSGDSSIGMLGPPAGPGGQTGKRHGRVLPRSNKERPAGQMRSNSAEQQTHQKPQLVSI